MSATKNPRALVKSSKWKDDGLRMGIILRTPLQAT